VASQDDVRRIALALPDSTEGDDRFAFSVRHGAKEKAFAFVWMERLEPKQPRVPNPDVLAVRVANEAEKQALIAAAPDRFFTEHHYNGYPAVLVRLPAIDVDELAELLTDAWRTQAPKALVRAFDADRR
jgi:hypothetical protein